MPYGTRTTNRVAIIGAGPAGIVCARWLVSRGFDPILFEASADLGGQWNAGSPLSATWPGLVTNTSRVMTAFSDLDHPDGTPTYPSREAMHAYLLEYAELFDLIGRIRLSTTVTWLTRDGDNWRLSLSEAGPDGPVRSDICVPHVVVAVGRQTAPDLPDVPGLEGFSGRFGVHHTASYAGAAAYGEATVLVGGCSISALEIATDLANAGARVIAAYRRQRYVLPKLQAGVPTEHVMFTRAAGLGSERLPEEAMSAGLREHILAVSGRPEQWGALPAAADVRTAGITQAQGFLPAVAEGRIRTPGWIESIDGQDVTFADGTREPVDAILFGTGFKLSIPFLDPTLNDTLKAGPDGLDLYGETFHPDCPGLAFIGQYNLTGPYFPVLELQARWLASVWAGPGPDADRMRTELASGRYRPVRGTNVPMHVMALLFSRLAGVEPDIAEDPGLTRALLFGPLSPASFRLSGPDARQDARHRTLQAAAAFGHIEGPEMSPDQAAFREAISA